MGTGRSVLSFRYGVFDLDGTLVDSMGGCVRVICELMAAYGISPADATASYLSDTCLGLDDCLRQILSDHGRRFRDADIARLHAKFNEKIRRERMDFFPGARRVIHKLRDKGLNLFVSSGSPDETVDRRLGAELVRGMFVRALGSTAVPKGPEHIEIFARAAGVTVAEFAANAFICGDLERDMAIARDCGLYAIGVLGTISAERLRQAGSKRLIKNVRDLLTDRP